MQSTVMMIMDLKARMDLFVSEADPQYEVAFNDLMDMNEDAFHDLHQALHDAHRALTKASALRAATDTKEKYKDLIDGR